jgi:hypothetical protein
LTQKKRSFFKKNHKKIRGIEIAIKKNSGALRYIFFCFFKMEKKSRGPKKQKKIGALR